jgi:hypothetical protein
VARQPDAQAVVEQATDAQRVMFVRASGSGVGLRAGGSPSRGENELRGVWAMRGRGGGVDREGCKMLKRLGFLMWAAVGLWLLGQIRYFVKYLGKFGNLLKYLSKFGIQKPGTEQEPNFFSSIIFGSVFDIFGLVSVFSILCPG